MDTLEPPSSRLPPIHSLANCSPDVLARALRFLAGLYSPTFRKQRFIERRERCNRLTVGDGYKSPYTSVDNTISQFDAVKDAEQARPSIGAHAHGQNTEMNALRADAFERAYALRWLTVLVSQSCPEPETDHGTGSTSQPYTHHHAQEEAASILALCAGASAAGVHTRRFHFGAFRNNRGPSPGIDFDRIEELGLEVSVRDAPLDNGDYASVGTQTWGSACVLAEMLVDDPIAFGLVLPSGRTTDSLWEPTVTSVNIGQASQNGGTVRLEVLELGAGTGLISLAIANVLRDSAGKKISSQLEQPTSDVTSACTTNPLSFPFSVIATDFYPASLTNLRHNISLNTLCDSVQVRFLDWEAVATSGRAGPLYPNEHSDLVGYGGVEGPFDVIVGADVVYELKHAAWIKACVEKFLRRPARLHSRTPEASPSLGPSDLKDSASSYCYVEAEPRFHLVIPLRAGHVVECETVETVFPLVGNVIGRRASDSGYFEDSSASKWELGIEYMENIVCPPGEGQVEDETYVHYKIVWC